MAGHVRPAALGISGWDFVLKFGRHLPGAPVDVPATEVSARETEAAATTAPEGAAVAPPTVPDNGRWKLSGQLGIDCMVCHGNGAAYDSEAWWNQITKQNFAWAPAVALGIADVDGDVSKLPADFDPAAKPASPPGNAVENPAPAGEGTEEAKKDEAATGDQESKPEEADAAADQGASEPAADAGPSLPKTKYRALRLSTDKKIFFDVVRKPSNNACYFCHTTRVAGAAPHPTGPTMKTCICGPA